MIINDIEYDEEQIRNMMKNYNARKKVINDYAKRRYKKMKINLTCDDEELRKAAEDFITKNRDFTRRYYEKNDTVKKEYYNKRGLYKGPPLLPPPTIPFSLLKTSVIPNNNKMITTAKIAIAKLT